MAELIVYERNMLYAPCASAVAGEHDLLDFEPQLQAKDDEFAQIGVPNNDPHARQREVDRGHAPPLPGAQEKSPSSSATPGASTILGVCSTNWGPRCSECTPSADFAEAGMIEFGSRASGASRILRLDDDEFPTRRLLDWARRESAAPRFDAYRIFAARPDAAGGKALLFALAGTVGALRSLLTQFARASARCL